ncbi:MAG TPA: transglutaminase family protein [Chitinophagaceae bacterium]|nr:transglutaminase family protein [Chitinophagaceae bacterium]
MQENKEISALLHLVDDPDEEIFSTVSDKIISYGSGIIPNLEHLWETVPDEAVQERIEGLIHRLQYTDLQTECSNWNKYNSNDLLAGALLVAKYRYPDVDQTVAIQDVEKIRRNIWLELNNYLTSLEQANVIHSILYNYYQLKGNEIKYTAVDEFCIQKVLATKKGNVITNGILYLVLADLLNLPVRAINIPRQFILIFLKEDYVLDVDTTSIAEHIHFYIDPLTGQLFTQKDIENYFKRIAVPIIPSYFKSISNKKIIQVLLEEFSKCYDNDIDRYKKNELLALANLLNESN